MRDAGGALPVRIKNPVYTRHDFVPVSLHIWGELRGGKLYQWLLVSAQGTASIGAKIGTSRQRYSLAWLHLCISCQRNFCGSRFLEAL